MINFAASMVGHWHGGLGARLTLVPGAAHPSNVEQAEFVTRAMPGFLLGLEQPAAAHLPARCNLAKCRSRPPECRD